MARSSDLDRFYSCLDSAHRCLGGYRRLADCSGHLDWPARGIFFLFEEGERRAGGDGLRVVHVGTHGLLEGSRSTLWQRLAQHRGTLKPVGGNHRGSILRLHVGDALLRSGQSPVPVSDTWGKGSSAPSQTRERERPLEVLVSQVIGQMPLLWVAIEDPPGPESLRGYIERNAIALLSNCKADPPLASSSPGWLGRFSSREDVRTSGLWNVDHVGRDYDRNFLTILEDLVVAEYSLATSSDEVPGRVRR